ncbi:hypothetical protein [Acidovorax sp.]
MKLPYRWIRNLHLLSSPLIGAFVYSRSLSDLEIVGCKSTAAVHF